MTFYGIRFILNVDGKYLHDVYPFPAGRILRKKCNIFRSVRRPSVDKAVMKKIFDDYEKIRDRILCRLVSAERRQSMPENIVSITCLDLSVIFCLFPDDPESRGRRVFEISEEDLRRWGIERARLIRDAYENTGKRYRYLFRRLADVTEAIEKNTERFLCDPVSVIEGIPEIEEAEGKKSEEPYTLINSELFNGSVILLYPDRLAEFAEKLGRDLILLPSSVNELVCLGWTENLDLERLQSIVMSVNRTCVSEEDVLSDSLYRYIRRENRVEIIRTGDEADAEKILKDAGRKGQMCHGPDSVRKRERKEAAAEERRE